MAPPLDLEGCDPGGFASRPATAGHGWGSLYSVDFATKPSALLAPGPNVIDAKTWWFKNTFADVAESFSLVSGQGLRIRQYGSATDYGYATGPLTQAHLYLDFDGQIAGYNPDAPCVLQARWQAHDYAFPSNVCGVVSMFASTEDASAVTDAQRVGLNYAPCDVTGTGYRDTVSVCNGAFNSYNYIQTSFSGAINRQVFSIGHPAMARLGVSNTHTVATDTDWPDVPEAALTRYFSPIPRYDGGAVAAPRMGACLWFENHIGPAFGIRQHTLRALRVLQPVVAP